MKNLIGIIIICSALFSCGNKKKTPDISNTKVHLITQRFDQDFFDIDTNHVAGSLNQLMKKYPTFLPDFVINILGLDLDSLLISDHSQAAAIRLFIHDYKSIKDSSDLLYKNFQPQSDAIIKGLKYVKYYFPEYQLPDAIIPFIGPINANFETSFGPQGDVLTTHALGVGLQLHLGSEFSFYKSLEGQEQYPDYLANTFDALHIPVNCMRNIVDDLFHDKSNGRPLIEQMIEKGRRVYLLTQFLPTTPDHICIGYSENQMKEVYKNEAVIWDFFLNNELLNNSDPNIVKNYIGPSPKTQEFGDQSPGNLGTFSGLQIVKKYMDKYPETTLQDLMNKEPREIFNATKYKPRK